jgi:hypothetical protein
MAGIARLDCRPRSAVVVGTIGLSAAGFLLIITAKQPAALRALDPSDEHTRANTSPHTAPRQKGEALITHDD